MNTKRTRGPARLEVTEGDTDALLLVIEDLMTIRDHQGLNDEEFRAEMYDAMHIFWYGHTDYNMAL